jgi:hypothetical protein
LIDPTTRNWDAELLKSLFIDIDVNRILEIPLNNQGFDDFIAWVIIFNGDTRLVREKIYLHYVALLQQTLSGSFCGN